MWTYVSSSTAAMNKHKFNIVKVVLFSESLRGETFCKRETESLACIFILKDVLLLFFTFLFVEFRAYCSVFFTLFYFLMYFILCAACSFETVFTIKYSSISSKGMVFESTRKMETRGKASHAETLGGSCEWRCKWWAEQQHRKRKCRKQRQRKCRQHKFHQPSSANNAKDTFELRFQFHVLHSATYRHDGWKL